MPRRENECAGCGEDIPEDFDLGTDAPTEYCSEACYEKRPLGTGWSPSDKFGRD